MFGAVRANHCIPKAEGIFYFEVEVLECQKDRQEPHTDVFQSKLPVKY